MKISSPLIILVALTASSITPSVEGRKRRSKAKSEKIEELSPDVATATASASSSVKSAKSAKSSSAKSVKAKKLYFDECSIANPPYEQAKLVTGDSGLTQTEYLTDKLLNKGVNGYLALHSTNVYMTFSDWVEKWVENPSDTTKATITAAGETTGEAHASLSLTAEVQCAMMDALVNQMKDSCNFKYSGQKDAYVQVASAYMTGFNSKAGEKKDDFVASCNLGSIWE